MTFIFTASQLTAISNALGDTSIGLTNSEIDYLISNVDLETSAKGKTNGREYLTLSFTTKICVKTE
jgi:hypothetical protein